MASVYTVMPLTQEARDWIAENVQAESWQWLGPVLCIEQRFMADLVTGMVEYGLVDGKDFEVGS